MILNMKLKILYSIGCLVIGLNIQQATCQPTNSADKKNGVPGNVADGQGVPGYFVGVPTIISEGTSHPANAEKGESKKNDISRNAVDGESESHDYHVEEPTEDTVAGMEHGWYVEFLEKAQLLRAIVNEIRKLLLEKKEMKELFGEELQMLQNFKQLNSDLSFVAGGELAIRYYLKDHPNHAVLLDSAVEIWIGIVLESNKEFKKTSKEVHQSLMNADPQSNYFTEIANRVIDNHRNLVTDLEKNDFTRAVHIKLNNFSEILTNTELERKTFRKISALYKQGLFDDIYESLGDENMDYLLSAFSGGL